MLQGLDYVWVTAQCTDADDHLILREIFAPFHPAKPLVFHHEGTKRTKRAAAPRCEVNYNQSGLCMMMAKRPACWFEMPKRASQLHEG